MKANLIQRGPASFGLVLLTLLCVSGCDTLMQLETRDSREWHSQLENAQ